MTTYLDRLNLRPFEKRLVVGVAAALFVVVNLVFVFPHFSDWGRIKGRMYKAQRTLATFEAEIHEMRKYQAEVNKLESEGGQAVPPEDQAVQFLRTIQGQAAESGVNITGTMKTQTHTNQFFLEQSQTISLVSQERPLVDFLFNLGSGNSLIRVRDLTLKPDQPRQQLAANIKLVASYQKKAPPKSSGPVASSNKSTAPEPKAAGHKPGGPLGKTDSRPTAPSVQPTTKPPKRP